MAQETGKGLNATGVAPYDVTSRDGGNQTNGVLDQVRPTGVLATGKRKMGIGDRNGDRSPKMR